MQPHRMNPGKNDLRKRRKTLLRIGADLSTHRAGLIIIGMLAVWLCGCTAQEQTGAPTATVGITPADATTTAIIVTGTVSPPTETSIPTVTATQRPTNTPTVVPSRTPTVTPMPTLSYQDAWDLIFKGIYAGQNCSAACLWGLEPGVTKANLAKATLLNWSAAFERYKVEQSTDNDQVVLTDYYWVDETSSHAAVISFYLGKGLLQTIRVSMSGMNDPELAVELREAFSLGNLLKNFGTPTKVEMNIAEGPGQRLIYEMNVFYDRQALSAVYQVGEWQGYVDTRRVCPTTTTSSVKLWLGATQTGTPKPDDRHSFDLAEISSLTLDEFANVLAVPGACFEVNEAVLRGQP